MEYNADWDVFIQNYLHSFRSNTTLQTLVTQLNDRKADYNGENPCRICQDAEPDVEFRDCGHFSSCQICLLGLKIVAENREGTDKSVRCPQCNVSCTGWRIMK